MFIKKNTLSLKKIITILLILVLNIGSISAYTSTQLDSEKVIYKKVIENKISKKLEKISEEKLNKILDLIGTYIIKYESNTTLKNSKKLQKIAILIAFKEIIEEKLEDDFSDINNIFEEVNKKIEVTMITDKRCWEECNIEPIISQLKQISELSSIEFNILDYDEEEAKTILEKNGIKLLPAAIFSNNNILELNSFLKETNSWDYKLELWAKFDPTAKMSEKWFKIIDKEIIDKIKNNSYIKWNKNSKILYLEYSDLECPFCAKLHNSWVLTNLEEKYWTQLSYSLQHFPLGFHKDALPGAEALECLAKQKWETFYFELEHIIFENKKTNLDFIVGEAVKLWANKEILEKCIEDKEFEEKINSQQKLWTDLFWITWTPGNVLINVETWEYSVISWAYPLSSFEDIIDRLLK